MEICNALANLMLSVMINVGGQTAQACIDPYAIEAYVQSEQHCILYTQSHEYNTNESCRAIINRLNFLQSEIVYDYDYSE